MNHIIREQDVKDFESQLEEHQNIERGDGYKVLDKALIQHNIVVVSKIYMNITFEQLGTFLRMSTLKAEEFVAEMIAAGTIRGELD
jgi:COP9 signalosome complex subunit 4